MRYNICLNDSQAIYLAIKLLFPWELFNEILYKINL